MMLAKRSGNSQEETQRLMTHDNEVPMQAAPNRLVLVRELKDAQAVGGKHAGAVW